MYTRILRFIAVAFVGGLLVPLLPAQSSVPQSYTLTVSTGLAFEAMSANSAVEAKVSRFGPREFVDVTVAFRRGTPRPFTRAIGSTWWLTRPTPSM